MELSNIKRNIKTIYHIADIHIRKSDRHEEYLQVFDRLYTTIKKDCTNSLIVCCGDVLHEGLSPNAIVMVKQLFINLAKITDVIVIIGNHDLSSRSDITATDYLSPILLNLETKHKIHVLLEGGLYFYDNIVFGLTTMHAKNVTPCDIKNKIKIALWHGTVHGSTNNNDYVLSNSALFNVTDFCDYDYVLLGDVHKHQYLNKSKTIAYPSSLIQQSHGEDLKYHGCIKWDIKHEESEFICLHNDYGYCTINIENDNIPDFFLPKNVSLRIIHKNTKQETINILLERISKTSKILECVYERLDDDIIITFGTKKETINKIKNDNMAIKILDRHIEKNYQYEQNETNEINNMIKRIMKKLKYNYTNVERNIKLKSLSFDNVHIYDEGNFIDYEKLKGIVNLTGENYVGKSSTIYALIYAIYGGVEQGDSKYDFVNIQKKKIYTKVVLDINGVTYEIERKGTITGKNRVEFKGELIVKKDGRDISLKNQKETENMIQSIVCNRTDLLNVSIMDQKLCQSFIDMPDNEKRTYICNILKLDIYNDISKYAQRESRCLSAKMYVYNKSIYDTTSKGVRNDKTKTIKREIKTLGKKEHKLNKKIIRDRKILSEFIQNKIALEVKLGSFEKIDINQDQLFIDDLNNTYEINLCANEKDNIDGQIDLITLEKRVIGNQIAKLGDINTIKQDFDNRIKRSIKKLNDDIECLLESKENFHNICDINELNNDKQHYESDLNEILCNITRIESKIEKLSSKIVERDFTDKIDEIYEVTIRLKNEIEELTREKEDYIKRLKVIKNHKYNPKCEACMENKITKDKIDFEIKISNIESELKIKEKKYAKYEKYEQEYDDKLEIQNSNNKINTEMEKERNKLMLLQKESETIKINLQHCIKEINHYDRVQKAMSDNKKTDRIIENKRKEIEILHNQKCDAYISYVNLNNMRNELNHNLANLNAKKILICDRMTELQNLNDDINDKKEKIEKYATQMNDYDELQRVTNKYDKITERLKCNEHEFSEIKNRLLILNKELEDINKAKICVDELEKEKLIYDRVADIINNGLVDSILSNTILPEFEKIVNTILMSFVQYKMKIIYDKTTKVPSIKVYKEEGGNMTNSHKLSGYEGLMANIAFRMALNQINKNVKTNFFMMDEVFAFCDNVAIKKMSTLFDYMRKMFDWVLIITHNDQIKNYADVEIGINKNNGCSHIEIHKNGKIENYMA